jgi:phospholipase C
MGYFKRQDLPFQFALAEAFTICDAYHCSVTTGTDPNRIVFWSGSNFDPALRVRGENSTDTHSEPDNLRCWIKGALPEPGYTYAGNAFNWPTIPDVLEKAGVSWRIYQNPNDNWTGAMHGCLAFESFRTAARGSALYEKGMTHWSLDQLAEDVRKDVLPQVSWILPPQIWSEHPSPSSPLQGAELTTRVLNALTSNPAVWAKTVFILAFDENDGLFDHVPPPAPPSYNADGTLAGKSTLDLRGLYFSDPQRKYLAAEDKISGTTRPWGLGPRVPMYIVSPWSRGGWVSSQVFDHTSIGQFIEKRFGVTVPAISSWHRAVCGDLTSAFDFATPNESAPPAFPEVNASAGLLAAIQRPKPIPPEQPAPIFQEPGTRLSRALPYELHVDASTDAQEGAISLAFKNAGKAGAVFHVYDRLHLDRIPRRFTVEAGKALADVWTGDAYDLWVLGPNGFLREFKGQLNKAGSRTGSEIEVRFDVKKFAVRLTVVNRDRAKRQFTITPNAYFAEGPWILTVDPGKSRSREWPLAASSSWYDFTVTSDTFMRRFAGRMETGAHGISDPAMGVS